MTPRIITSVLLSLVSAPLQLFFEDGLQKMSHILSRFLKDVVSSIFEIKSDFSLKFNVDWSKGP